MKTLLSVTLAGFLFGLLVGCSQSNIPVTLKGTGNEPSMIGLPKPPTLPDPPGKKDTKKE